MRNESLIVTILCYSLKCNRHHLTLHHALATQNTAICSRTLLPRSKEPIETPEPELGLITPSPDQVKLIPEAHKTAMANKRLFEDLGFGEDGAEVSRRPGAVAKGLLPLKRVERWCVVVALTATASPARRVHWVVF